MFINGEPISKYGGILLGTPRVSNAEYIPEYVYTRARSTLRHLTYDIGLKSLQCNIAFLGDSVFEIQQKRSILRAALVGELQISFSKDRFLYQAEYIGDAELESQYESAAVSMFNFKCVQMLPLETIATNNKKVHCQSTMPQTDCKLTAMATANTSNFVLGTVTFSSVSANDVLVVDGINGLITKNGNPETANFIRLPYLVPGENTITSTVSNLTVEYYPTFI